MNLNQLGYFVAVCTYQSVSKAAEHLHISQPSLSGVIRELENEFGVTLFTRPYRGVRMTPEGQTLYDLAKNLLHQADQVRTVMQELGNGRKVLKLGVPPMIGSLILPRIYQDLADAGISLEITEGGYHDLLKRLTEQEVDLAFLPHTGTPDPALTCLSAATLEVCCCGKAGHPLSQGAPIGPEALAGTPLVLFENSFLQTELILQWFRTSRVQPQILLQTQQLSTMLQMLESGQAMGFLFRELAQSRPSLEVLPAKAPIFLQVSLAWRTGIPKSHAMDVFLEYMKTNDPFA